MELQDHLAAVREMLGDQAEPPRWSDETLTRYLNNAVREVCIRARLLKADAVSHPDLFVVTLVADTARYALDAKVLALQRAILVDATTPLELVTAHTMDRLVEGWDNGSPETGTPAYGVMDLEQKSLTLYPTPDAATTLRLRGWRLPLDTELMEVDDDEPVVLIPDEENLKHWVGYEALQHRDMEEADRARSDYHLTVFTSVFGGRPDFHEMARWADSPPTPARLRAHFL